MQVVIDVPKSFVGVNAAEGISQGIQHIFTPVSACRIFGLDAMDNVVHVALEEAWCWFGAISFDAA